MPAKIKFYDKDGNLRTIDQILKIEDGVLATVAHMEIEVHEGYAYTTSAVDLVMADAETLNIGFKTPLAPPRIHFIVGFSTLVGGYLQILEGATWAAASGTTTDIFNRNRELPIRQSGLLEDKTYTPTFVVTGHVLANVGIAVAGTAIWTRYAWGEKGKIEVGDYRAENELMLRPDTQYVARFTAIGAANTGQIIMNWIEH